MNNKDKFKIIGWDVDTQRGFMETEEFAGYQGKLALLDDDLNPIGAMEIADNLRLVGDYLNLRKIPRFASVDWHNSDSKEFDDTNPDFVNTFPSHCVRDTYDAQNIDATKKINPLNIDWDDKYEIGNLVERIRSHDGEVVFRKDNFNVFLDRGSINVGVGNPYAKKVIKNLGVEKAIVYGVASDVCVKYAVDGFRNLGVEVYVIEDVIRGVTPTSHKNQIAKWKIEGVNIVSLEDLLLGKIV